MTAIVKSALNEDEIRARIASVPLWFHQIEVAPGIVTPGIDPSAQKLERLNIPEDLTGKRVLDIGAFDGFFSFECERRGAEVVAIDANSNTGLQVARELLGSRITFHKMNIYDITPQALGQFDLVLCLGVLYHLRHPLLGLERIHAVCKGELILETHVCDHYFIDSVGVPHELAAIARALLQVPIARFYPSGEYNGDASNWWAPNIRALHDMLSTVGFLPDREISVGDRICVHCSRVEQPVSVEGGWAGDNSQLTLAELSGNRRLEKQERIVASEVESKNKKDRGNQREVAFADTIEVSVQNDQLRLVLAQRETQIADLEARARWLEGQAREAHRELVAVQQGRVLRLLRWLSRAG